MKATAAFLFVLSVLLRSSASVLAQESSATDIDQLKAQMRLQQKLLEKQQEQIQALESALAEQQRLLAKAVQGNAYGAMSVPATGYPATDRKAEVQTQDK